MYVNWLSLRGCLVYIFLYIVFDKLLSHLSIVINLVKEHRRSSAHTLADQTEDKLTNT